jgi:carboxylate-amine ligase
MAFDATPHHPYDEVFTLDGALRYPYVELRRWLGTDPLRPAATTWQRLRDRPLADDTRILPIPWALDGAEYASVVASGISQRARALQMFFADLVLGSQRFLDGASLARERLQVIMRSEGTSLAGLQALWRGHATEEIRFVYGPDLVRGPDGRWLLLEDNIGCVGGSADGHVVWGRYLAAAGAPRRALPPGEPDLRVALCRWLDRLGLSSGNERVVGLLGCEGGGVLHSMLIHENARRRLILQQAGIGVADPGQLRQLLSANGAAGCGVRAILNFHSLSELIDEAFRRRIALFNAPGTGILGNKALLPHVGEMIRFFLGEEPVIATPPTHVCADGTLPLQPEDWVVKSVSGCQGTEVFMLRGQPPERLDAIRALVRESWPDQPFVAQQRVEPSRLSSSGPGSWEAHPVELRPVAYVVGWSQVHVSDRPVGKAVWGFDARGQHNLSQGACYVPVTVLTPSPAGTL